MTSPGLFRVMPLNGLLALVALAVGLTGCGRGSDGNAGEESVAPATHATPSETAATPSSSAAAPTSTPLVVEFQGQQLTGQLDASATAASLLEQLPLTLTFSDFGGQEKIADLPSPLDLSDAPEGSAATPGTIGYYSPTKVWSSTTQR
ncbi:cyclophilin-like fold protein [Nesterenkonia pannonica]|uniref:cyclophilin-like fold protein n=1 Tax=Nesterenkonia pannonica TaxID=1548602 RepID=UPI002164421E|nr:cyclophilin-like fold protein [Nesterenkonia pannonica]